jgi:hypothetical protein
VPEQHAPVRLALLIRLTAQRAMVQANG